MKRIRVRKEYRFKFWIFIFIILSLCFIFIPRSNRAMMTSFFSKRCISDQQVYSRRLKDRVVDYSSFAKLSGIEKCADGGDITRKVLSGQLFPVSSGRYYKVEDMTHSYPYLTRDAKILLNEIGRRFDDKISGEGFKGSRFLVTSMTRTSEKL
ncbi:MAG TPA: DUF5715 family protein, partial [Bacteroidales bacterium]|nr:DUF5715 family protein [Bacteroidales bacterium]